ncbi:translation initiation factor IF-3 [Paenibacillus sp. GCM10027626]|uniref:translation initiation factor IF-3 n=1 Tax=Paenibacillus sp. GCM10027626 TaxID=3273411 RepID=UPI00363CF2F6
MILNEKVKASEVQLTGLNGEDMGIVSRAEALAMAKQYKADLVGTSLMSSPPPCKLVARGQAKQESNKAKHDERKRSGVPMKVKELRLTANIEDHDYETKRRQAGKWLDSGNSVQLVIKLQGAKEGQRARELLEQLAKDLTVHGTKETGIQVSGKQAAVKLCPH